MEKQEYKALYELEENHWWFKSMRYLTSDILNRTLSQDAKDNKNLLILDAGCGTGINAKKLENYGKVVGIDVSQDAVNFSKLRRVNVMVSSVNSLPFKDNTFDVITSFEVLNLRKIDSVGVLKEFERVIKPGGIILVRVSAYNWLYSKHDDVTHTEKRHTISSFKSLLNNASLKISKLSYVCAFLFPLICAKRLFDKFINKEYSQSELVQTNIFGGFFYSLMKLETKLLRYSNLPFGLQVLGILRKASNK